MPYIFTEDNRIEKDYGRYGWVRGGGRTFHAGVDVDTLGDPTIHSTVDGYVEYSAWFPWNSTDATREWGEHVRIYEGQADATRRAGTRRHVFAHNKKGGNKVRAGQLVKAGQPIAVMGMTGNASVNGDGVTRADPQGPHVHYQVDVWTWNATKGKYGWAPTDPTQWCGGNRVGVWRAGAQPVPVPAKEKEERMKIARFFGKGKGINVEAFARPNANSAVKLAGVPDGRYWVVKSGLTGEDEYSRKWAWFSFIYSKGGVDMELFAPLAADRCEVLDEDVLAVHKRDVTDASKPGAELEAYRKAVGRAREALAGL